METIVKVELKEGAWRKSLFNRLLIISKGVF